LSASVRPFAYLGGAVVLWGTSYAVTKTAYATLPPMYVVWFRMLVAGAAFLVIMPRIKRPTYQRGDWILLVAAMAFIPCLYYTCEGFAISLTTSSQAGVVTATMPLIVAVVAWFVLRERPGTPTILAIVVSVAGVAVLSLGGTAQAGATNPTLGNILELGAMLAASGSTLVVKRLSSRYDPLLLTGMQMGAGLLFFAPLALASGPVHLGAISLATWASIVYLGLGCGLGAFGLYNSALRLLPTSQAALTINAIPVVALVTGWLALHETMAPLQIGACVVILAAVIYAQLARRAPVPPSPDDVRIH